jgi:hypothetical protein
MDVYPYLFMFICVFRLEVRSLRLLDPRSRALPVYIRSFCDPDVSCLDFPVSKCGSAAIYVKFAYFDTLNRVLRARNSGGCTQLQSRGP